MKFTDAYKTALNDLGYTPEQAQAALERNMKLFPLPPDLANEDFTEAEAREMIEAFKEAVITTTAAINEITVLVDREELMDPPRDIPKD